ncbi:MAG: hypothetical protein OXI16_15315 [Chloroflexota bacterium]|jgi:Zn ribbon nucleic-acid-binding protein|nr:hypothetical protein [Chloroflexota bacterium]MDE2688847.1 hypothetical protein [Chloroflexota bacterium]MYC07183.1 hypothetical protein [Chloroflexota bacterium]
MVEFKACPRCAGDLKLTRDMYGDYRECLQCGYTKDIIPEPKTNFDWAKTRGKPGRRRKTKVAA